MPRAVADPNNPAIKDILDCVEYGLPQSFEGAIRSEMAIFAALTQWPEPRDVIQTLFLGKADNDRATRKGEVPAFIADAVNAAKSVSGSFADIGALRQISDAVSPCSDRPVDELRMAGYAIVRETGFPAHLGGPFTFLLRDFD